MKRLRMGAIPLELHPLMPLMLLLALQTGLKEEALAVLPALLVHESAHLCAARTCGVFVSSVSLTPFGAAIHLQQPWNAQPWRIVCISLAGPAANLLLVCLYAAAAYASVLSPHTALLLLKPNLILMAINLLPALPLDGGRALCALLSARFGTGKAVRIGTVLGYLLAASLLAAVVWSGIVCGIWNVALIGSAAYLIACAAKEADAAAAVNAQALVLRSDELRRRAALPVKIIAVAQDTLLGSAMRLIGPGSVHVLLLLDEEMRPVGVLAEGELLSRFPADASVPLRALCKQSAAHAFAGRS